MRGPRAEGYMFTSRAQAVLTLAREEAAGLAHEYVGTEHLLLGLLREGGGVARAVFENLGADLDAVRATVLGIVTHGEHRAARDATLPYTSRALRALELSMTSARELHHQFVGTEHLLLGLLGDPSSPAAQCLGAAGVTLDRARSETLRLLGHGGAPVVDGSDRPDTGPDADSPPQERA